MSRRRLLVVTTVPVDGAALRERVLQDANDRDSEVKIVAPAADVSPLQWLASDEDAAREEAHEVADQAAEGLGPAGRVETEVGDPDPVQAIEDALRTFEADEVIVVTRPGEEANWLEKDAGAEARERFGVPVRHLQVES
jgi:nucleotide-binding universal stress UspA family protein